jgi:hypothetical protein
MLSRRTHPEVGDLIRYCDGELRAKETARVARHLKACWDCRTRLDDLKQTIGEYVRYRRDVLEPALPPPPQPWQDLHTEFARMQPSRRRWSNLFQRPTVWLIAGTVMAGTGILLYTTNQGKPVPERPVNAALAIAPRIAPPSHPIARKTTPSTEDELRVIAALDRIGADLGDPIEVIRTPDRITVTCMGLAPARIAQVRTALAGMPGVVVELSPKPAAAPTGAPLDVVGAPHTADDEQVADALLKSSEAMMARAHALRSLALRFPAQVEAQMSTSARETLANIRQHHEAALSREVAAIARSVEPLPQTTPAPTEEDWQSRTLRLFSDAEQVDRLLGAIYAGHRAAGASDRSTADLEAAVASLSADLNH